MIKYRAKPGSVNFHLVTDGSHCVSYTNGNGFEYSEQGGAQFYTQCFIVPHELQMTFAFTRFGYSKPSRPKATSKYFCVFPSVRILGRDSSVNTETISAMAYDLDADKLTPLLNIVIRYGPFSVSSVADVER